MSFYLNKYPSPIGEIFALCDGEAVLRLWFGGQRYVKPLPTDIKYETCEAYFKCAEWLDLYFAGKEPSFLPKIKPEGSLFQKAVWGILQRIPYGQTTTYGRIAKEVELVLGKSACAQAVGGAVGRNPIAIIIPCHRVVGADGGLVGYAGGLDKKVGLLRIEHAAK